ncbi:hypothetical protein EBQ81_06500, partial [bacterium]|nr:hypothetical protein [bacterium]
MSTLTNQQLTDFYNMYRKLQGNLKSLSSGSFKDVIIFFLDPTNTKVNKINFSIQSVADEIVR